MGKAMDEVSLKEKHLNILQRVTLDYYIHEINHAKGLIADKTQAGAPASIAADIGLLASVKSTD